MAKQQQKRERRRSSSHSHSHSPSHSRLSVPASFTKKLRAKLTLAHRILFMFCLGGALYYLIEIAYRGYSHFSMFLCGGVCMLGLYGIYQLYRSNFAPIRWFVGALYITLTEFWFGVVVNLFLDWHVWDYTDMPYNVLGQICLPFSLMWFLLCIPVDLLCALLHRYYHLPGKQKQTDPM